MPGYIMTEKDRVNNRGGVVCIHVKTGLQFKLCDDLGVFKEGISESVFVELTA